MSVPAPSQRLRVPRTWRGNPIWLPETPTKQQRYPSLGGHHSADVVIVGGGMTGALTASAFAEAGVSVVLVEGERIGRGSTAASSALLLQEPDQGIGELMRRYGKRAAIRIWQLSHEAVRNLVRTLRRLRIDCDLVQRDAVFFAPNDDCISTLRREFTLRIASGFGARWLDAAAVKRLTGISSPAAIRTQGNAQFDPFKACVGVLSSAAKSGARIFERSPVVRVETRGGGVRVVTARGHVDASRVIIATGYATEQFRPLAERFRMYHTYVLATPPLRPAQQRAIGLGPVMVWDTQRPYHYARWTPDRRLLLGGGDRRAAKKTETDTRFGEATRALHGDFCQLLPRLADVGVERAWSGLFAMTPDSLPYIGGHRRYPRHLFALGYGGNGMTFAFMAARMLLEQWQGVRSPDHALFRFGRLR